MAHAPDEFLSAMLDGEPAPGDAAHVAECDVCQSRLADLRGAAVAVGAPVPAPPDHIREAAMREALLVADDKANASGPLLPFRRTSKRPSPTRSRRTSPLSAAAALLVAVLVGGFALSQIGHGGGNARVNETAAATSPSPNADTANALGGSSKAAIAPHDAADVGAVDDINALITRANTDLTGTNAAGALTASASSPPCAYDGGDTLLWQATLTYQGRAAVAHYVKRGDTQVMQILAAADCSLIASQDFVPTTPR